MRRTGWNNNEESSNRWQLNIYVAESRSSIAFNNFPAGFSSLDSRFFDTDITLFFVSFDFWYQRVTRLCAEGNQRIGKQSDSSSFLRGAICHSYIFRDALRGLSEDQRRAWSAQWPERETGSKGTFGLLVSADRSNRNKSAARRTGSRIAWMRHGVHARRRPRTRETGAGGVDVVFFGGTCGIANTIPGPSRRREEMYRQMFFTCQVQYLNDVDPFSYPTLYPDDDPPNHTFSVTLPLINQLAAVHRLLRAPHRVSRCFRPIYATI